MRQRYMLVVAIISVGAVAAACGGSTTGSGGRSGSGRSFAHGTFTVAISEDFGSFDVYRNNTLTYGPLAYDSLVNLRPDGAFASGLAQKWTADARSASFTLRPGITCSDGTSLTASQVATDLNYIGDPRNKSRQYGVNTPTSPFTATADDSTGTVKVVMKTEPFGFLLNTIGQAPIVCAAGFKNPKLLRSASAGTGPFVLANAVPGQSYTFTVRKGYTWGPDGASTSAPGTPDKVVLRVISNQSTAANLLLSGEVNMAGVAGADQKRLDAQGLDKFEVAASGAGLKFNHLPGHPTADEQVRRALMQALDIAKVINVSTGGTGGASTGLIALEPKPCAGNPVAGQLPRYDVAAAEASLDDAGWQKGADGIRVKNGKPLTIDLHYVPSVFPLDKPTAELLEQEWNVIGVKVKHTTDTLVSFPHTMYETSNWDVFMGLGAGYLPSQNVPFYSGPFPPKGLNGSGIDNKNYDALVAKAKALTTPAACTYWNQAEQALYSAVDVAPISNRPSFSYLKNARAQAAGFNNPIPTSIRLLK